MKLPILKCMSRRSLGLSALCLATVLLLSGCVMMQNRIVHGISINVSKPFLLAQEEIKGWGQMDHPFIWSYGKWTMVGYNVGGETVGMGFDISDDEGKTWKTIPRPPITGQYAPLDDGSMAIFRLENHLGLLTKNNALSCVLTPEQLERGLTEAPEWTPSFIYLPEKVPYLDMAPRGVALSRNEWCFIAHTRFDEDDGGIRCVLMKTTDGGTNLHYWSTIAADEHAPWGNEAGPSEGAIVKLSNGDLFCVIRTGSITRFGAPFASTPMISARSSDGGKTWVRRRMTQPGVYPKMIMMSNGVIACAFGRPGNRIIFSTDDGASWTREFTVTAGDVRNVRTSGYMDLTEVSPGRLLIAYDEYDALTKKIWLWEPPPPVNAIWGAYIDVQRTK